jgi:FtsP/CotA-like multicopper oxidase with cupredoxin domain
MQFDKTDRQGVSWFLINRRLPSGRSTTTGPDLAGYAAKGPRERMLMPISRRELLSTGIAVVAAAATPPLRPATAATAAQRLTATTRTLDIDGKPARVFGLIGPGGKPGLTLAPGEPFRVDLANTTDVPTIIHWHGQTPPWKEDGFPWPQTPPLPAKGSRQYDFKPISGTYWMHSHHGLQSRA